MKFPHPMMLVYIAMADAYAAAAEYLRFPRDKDLRVKCLGFTGYQQHPTHVRTLPGMYTDDTEMAVANARVLIEHEPPYVPYMFADAYMREFIRGGMREGYAGRFQEFLTGVAKAENPGAEFLAKIRPDSAKNGACMRAMPFGVLPAVGQVLQVAELQAAITHNTPEGKFSAMAVAVMAHYALYESGPLHEVGNYCVEHLPKEYARRFGRVFRQVWRDGEVTSKTGVPVAITTVHAVVSLLRTKGSLMEMLEQAIAWGGDTDSVAAIAWGIASARFQDEELPLFLKRDLEQGKSETGVPYLSDLGAKLMEKFL